QRHRKRLMQSRVLGRLRRRQPVGLRRRADPLIEIDRPAEKLKIPPWNVIVRHRRLPSPLTAALPTARPPPPTRPAAKRHHLKPPPPETVPPRQRTTAPANGPNPPPHSNPPPRLKIF